MISATNTVAQSNLMAMLQISPSDIEKMAEISTGFRSMLIGTSAEIQLTRLLSANSELSFFEKNPDLDRTRRSDFTVNYRGIPFRIELKTENPDGRIRMKTSDRITYESNGVQFTTSAVPADRFDILAVSLFNRGKGWSFAFIDARELNRSSSKDLPEDARDSFLAGSINVEDYESMTSDPFTLFERILSE